MKKIKFRFITIISLAVLFAVLFGLAFATMNRRSAYAATSYNPTAIFAQGDRGDVTAYKKAGGEENEPAYTAFRISDEGKVYYRRNLALKWYAPESEENKYTSKEGNFNLKFMFAGVNFKTFTITFGSAEENVTKEGKTTNSIVFTKTGDKVTALVKDSAYDEETSTNTAKEIDASGWLTLTLKEGKNAGEFDVAIGDVKLDPFTNIGGYYLEYRSTAATPSNDPMTFTANMAEDNKEAVQVVLLSELNGQTLEVTGGTPELTDADGDGLLKVSGGKVEDKAPAVLVLNEKLYAFTLGKKFSLSYQAIDVCKDSVTVTRQYYMYKTDKDNKPLDPTSSDNYKTLTTSTYFMPTKDIDTENEAEEVYVSIRFMLSDGRGVTDPYVYLSWYAAENAVATKDYGTDGTFTYIKADRNKQGPHYVGLDEDGKTTNTDYEAAVDAYKTAVANAAKDISAGNGAYFYLPSLRGLIESDYADYRNLKFSIFYYNESQTEGDSASSKTSLAYNSLKFEISKEGTYLFRVLAVDAAGNGMQLYNEDGELVTVTSANIWDFEGIPEFSFTASYTGATIEKAGEQSLGYRDTTYNVSSFEVIALDDIEKTYTLYYLDESKIEGGAPTYSDFVKDVNDYMVKFDPEKEGTPLVKIKEFNSDITEKDDEWDESDNAYNWNPTSSLSFRPQRSGYYVVKLVVTDKELFNEPTTAYQVIEVRNPFDVTPGQSQWLQNNVVSIVLFAVSAVLLVIIIALFVVKPSDKKVEEVDLEKLKGKKKTKTK